jgi:hypothetical protein
MSFAIFTVATERSIVSSENLARAVATTNPRLNCGEYVMRINRLLQRICLAGLATGLAMQASAMQPSEPLAWKVSVGLLSGKAVAGANGGDDFYRVDFGSLDPKSNVLIVFPNCAQDPDTQGRPMFNLEAILQKKESLPKYDDAWKQPGPRWQVCPKERYVLLPSADLGVKASNSVSLVVDFLRLVSEGMSPSIKGDVYSLNREDAIGLAKNPEYLKKILATQHPGAELPLVRHYRLSTSGAWKAGEYEAIYGIPKTGGKTSTYSTKLPVNLDPYLKVVKLPRIEKDGGAALFKRTLANVYSKGSGLSDLIKPSLGAAAPVANPNAVSTVSALDLVGSPFQLSGIFSTKWTVDHSLHPGFGFRVEAWTNEGGWHLLAADWVQYNGTWSLSVPASAGYTGTHLQMRYRSNNQYYAPQDQGGNTYWWYDPDQANIPANFNAGHRYANTDGGSYNGVGELVDAAMNVWSSLYWRGGIDPVATSPIRFYFPNTWYDCGNGTGNPWSCANTSGNIWFIASHGTDAYVVAHEMGHQLNYKYWHGKNPANNGGSHTLGGCYPSRLGMALFEGFANYLAAWVGYPTRNQAQGGFTSPRWQVMYGNYDIESHDAPPNCTNGWENETWVARTFWDLHDTHGDNLDVLWFNHSGAVLSLYLNNGVANSGDARDMRDYNAIYQGAASPGHQGFVANIFTNNRD